MATTKKAVKFYADPVVEAHLETIDTQLRTNWINSVLLAAIENQEPTSELAQLNAWLKKQKNSPLYEALSEMLDDYAKAKKKK